MAQESNHADSLRRILVQVGIALKPICQQVHPIRDDFDCSDALKQVKEDLLECAKHMGQPEHEVHALFSSVDFLSTAHKKLTQEDPGINSKYLDGVVQVAEDLVAKCGEVGQEAASKLKQLKEGLKVRKSKKKLGGYEWHRKAEKAQETSEERADASKSLTTPAATEASPSSRPTTAGEGEADDPKQALIRDKFPWVIQFQHLLEHYKKQEDKDHIYLALGKCKKKIHARLDQLVETHRVLTPIKARLLEAKEEEDFERTKKLSEEMKGPKKKADTLVREISSGLFFGGAEPEHNGEVNKLCSLLLRDGTTEHTLTNAGFRT